MTKWKKPSGVVIELNDLPATVKKAESLGWKKAAKPGPKAKANGDGE